MLLLHISIALCACLQFLHINFCLEYSALELHSRETINTD